MSFSDTTTTCRASGAVQDEDIVEFDAGVWSVWFDGTAAGLTADNQDIDAFSFAGATHAAGLRRRRRRRTRWSSPPSGT